MLTIPSPGVQQKMWDMLSLKEGGQRGNIFMLRGAPQGMRV